jgi:monovalent cation:H+ antiporter-2, CPA2 family
MATRCVHLHSVKAVRPRASGCEECLALGDTWVHLRLCRTCGHVGCCDDSKNKHATKHFHSTGHPIITSFEPGEHWSWCYVDDMVVDLPLPRSS